MNTLIVTESADSSTIYAAAWVVDTRPDIRKIGESAQTITSHTVIPKRLFTILVFALPVLIVAFSAVMGAQALSRALADAPGARALDWAGLALLLLLIVDVVLLVGALGLNALADQQQDDEQS